MDVEGDSRESARILQERAEGSGKLTQVRSNAFRAKAPYILLLIMALAAIPLFFGAGWFGDFPSVAVYTGPLEFSGEEALKDVVALTKEYPGRVAGTRAARLSAQWVQSRFEDIGLESQTEEFDCLVMDPMVRQDRRTEVPVSLLTFSAPGYNVVAISPGRLENAVVFGAHRDVAGDYEGAEDNASGTASLLELARVLTKTSHEYTYYFVSYDGEEQGLRGSEAFIQANPGLNVALAVSLDMTGFDGANTVGFYPFVSNRSASPLWTQALARAVSRTSGLPIYQFGATEEISLNAAVTFWRVRSERLSSRVPTDTGPFVDRGIPSLGVFAGAVHGGRGSMGTIHGPRDSTEQVSAGTLQMTGSYVEQYVRSLPLDTGGDSLGSRFYYVSDDKVLSPNALYGLSVYSLVIVAAMAALTWRDSAGKYGPKSFAGFLRSDGLWMALSLGVAAFSAGYPALVRSALAKSFTIVTFNAVWGVLTVAGMVVVTLLRQRSLHRTDRPYHEVTASQKAILNLSYAVSFLALLILSGPLAALEASVFPILVLGRINFRSQESRTGWSIAAVVWIAVSMFTLRGRVSYAAVNPVVPRLLAADFFRISTWALTSVFMFSAPRRGTRAEESNG